MPLFILSGSEINVSPSGSGILVQSRTVSSSEASSGVLTGLTQINSLIKVEDIDGTVVSFNLDNSNQISTTENIYENQNLIIWHR